MICKLSVTKNEFFYTRYIRNIDVWSSWKFFLEYSCEFGLPFCGFSWSLFTEPSASIYHRALMLGWQEWSMQMGQLQCLYRNINKCTLNIKCRVYCTRHLYCMLASFLRAELISILQWLHWLPVMFRIKFIHCVTVRGISINKCLTCKNLLPFSLEPKWCGKN